MPFQPLTTVGVPGVVASMRRENIRGNMSRCLMGTILAALAGAAALHALPALHGKELVALAGDSRWEARELREGLTHYVAHFEDLFGAPQIVNVLAVDLDHPALRIELTAADVYGLSRRPIAEIASHAGAVAAINGGFGARQSRREVGFGIMKFRGKVWPFGDDPTFPNHEAEGRNAIGIDRDGRWHFASRGREGWETGSRWEGDWPEVEQAMAGGSRLVEDGQVHPLVVEATTRGAYLESNVLRRLTFRRHPRTAIGITPERIGLLVAVSGRHEGRAAGMTLEEAARLMVMLGSSDALEFDGGGSTTMWIAGPGNGVVNYPSDNGQFDQEGARSLRLAVLVLEAEDRAEPGDS
jgi:exopolysaccharide biosynthesis protein